MDEQRWPEVEQLLSTALALKGAARSAFLAHIADPEIRAEVGSLAQGDCRSDSHIEAAISAAARDLAPFPSGTVFPDRFQVLRQVGEGGMGKVFEAVDRQRNLRVALKTLSTLSPSHLYAFKQEFRSLSAISHPNLVTLYDLLQHERQFWLSMEFIEGRNPLEYIRGTGTQSGTCGGHSVCDMHRLRAVMYQVAAGVAAIHAAGKLHRDLKPSNMLVRDDGRAVILDFGLVIDVRHGPVGRHTGIVRGGTGAYMSPEQMDADLTSASDWYSFGVIMFEALTGRKPFQCSGYEMTAGRKAVDGPAPAVCTADCPDDLNRLCALLLRREPTSRPSAEQVLRILGEVTPGFQRDRPSEIFVGRERELEQLDAAFTGLSEGKARVVTVSAAAGTGKTALADRFLQRVSLRSDTVILGARCYEREGLPFKGVDSLIDQLTHFLTDSDIPLERISRRDVACLAAVFPVVAGVSAFAEAARAGVLSLDRVVLRRSALAALREVLVLIGQRRKLVIWLDDLHWIDRDSAELLHDVLCSSDPPLLLLLCTHRADLYPPMRLLLELLEREPIAKTSMDLKPLDADDAALLAESMLSRTVQNPHERALSIARDSGGLPIFICELARAAARLGAERLSLGSVIWRRVLALDEDSRKFMYILSIAGRPIAQALAFSAAGIESLNPIILNSLTQMGLVCTGGPGPTDTVEPYHDRIRETITKEIGAVEKRNLHRELARVLEGSPDPDPEMLASHLEACGELLKAGIYYERAAERAAVGVAFNTAAELYRRSLSLRDLSSEERARIELRLAEVLANAGKSAEASGCYFSAAQHLPSDERLRIEGLAAYHLCVGGHLDEARTKIEQLLGQIGRRPLGTGPRAIVKVLWHDLRCRLRGTCQRPASAGDVDPILLAQIDLLWFAAAGLGTSDLLGGFYLLQLSMELAQKAREPARMVRAYAWYAAMQVGQRLKHEHIETVFQRCRELSKQIGDPPASRATLAVTTAVRHYLVGSWLEALLNCREAERLLLEECHGLNWELAFTRGLKLTLLMNTGAISGLERQAREIMEDALSRGDLATATTIAAFPLPYSQILNGKPAVARDTWRYWVERWPPYLVRSNQEPYSVLIELWSYLYENDSDRAFALLRQRWEASIVHSQTLRLPVAAVYFLETRARILIQAAGRSHALQQQKLLNEPRRIIAKLRASPALHAKAHAMQIEALLHAIDGRSDIAVSAMRESSTMFQQCHMTIHAAASRLHAGRWMGGDLGQGWIAEAAQLMRSEGIADPDAVSRMLVSEIGP